MAIASLTLAANAGLAVSGSLTPRYEYVSVLNETGVEIWVRTDGTAATVDGDFCAAVANGERALLANTSPLWNQSQTVIAAGSVNQWAQAKNGGAANPGTQISFIPVTGTGLATTPTVTIQGAG
jgi:UDP-N-acetylmuramyl tripeptide synthase